MAQLFLGLTALVFAGFGLWGVIEPAAMMQRFDVPLQTGEAKTAVRAMYGGFLIGSGLLFAFTAISEKRVTFGLQAVLILSSAILVARMTGIVLDGAQSLYHTAYAALEAVGIIVSAVLLWMRRSKRDAMP